MKQIILLTLLLTGMTISVAAQPDRSERKERVEALAVAYITEKLDLTVEEAQLFWPVFNEFQEKRKEIRRSFKKRQNPEEMSEAEAGEYLEDSLLQEQQMLDLKKEYYGKMASVISVKKVALLPQAEKKFREELIKRVRGTRGGRNFGDSGH